MTWLYRECQRMLRSEYVQPDITDWPRVDLPKEPLASQEFTREHHYPHVSSKNPAAVAYTESADKGARDIQSVMKPGRYLTKYYPEMSADMIQEIARQWAEKYAPTDDVLLWAENPKDIGEVYQMPATFGSCMQYAVRHFDSDIHPTEIYGAGDLALAYIVQEKRLIARALVWREKNLVGRVYGDSARLRKALAANGMATRSGSNCYDNLAGARLLRIEDQGHVVMPYPDKPNSFTDHGDHLTLGGDLSGDTQNGLASIEPEYTCERCDESAHQEGLTPVIAANGADETWCESCADYAAFWCENREQYYSEEYYDRAVVHTAPQTQEAWCSDATDHLYFVCEYTEECYAYDYQDAIKLESGEIWCDSAFRENGFNCGVSGGAYPDFDGVVLDGDTVAKENLPPTAVEISPGVYELQKSFELEGAA
jgi:hypothetical protein